MKGKLASLDLACMQQFMTEYLLEAVDCGLVFVVVHPDIQGLLFQGDASQVLHLPCLSC